MLELSEDVETLHAKKFPVKGTFVTFFQSSELNVWYGVIGHGQLIGRWMVAVVTQTHVSTVEHVDILPTTVAVGVALMASIPHGA